MSNVLTSFNGVFISVIKDSNYNRAIEWGNQDGDRYDLGFDANNSAGAMNGHANQNEIRPYNIAFLPLISY